MVVAHGTLTVFPIVWSSYACMMIFLQTPLIELRRENWQKLLSSEGDINQQHHFSFSVYSALLYSSSVSVCVNITVYCCVYTVYLLYSKKYMYCIHSNIIYVNNKSTLFKNDACLCQHQH